MLTPQELNEAVLGTGWRWDEDDEILWVRAFVGPYRDPPAPVEIIASFMIVEADGVTVGYRDPEWYVEYDVRDAACERIHYAHVPLKLDDEQNVVRWLRQPASSAELSYAAEIYAVRHAPNETDQIAPESRPAAPVAGEGPVPVPEGKKQHYWVTYRVTGTFTYHVHSSSPECAFHAGDMAGWETMEFESDEIHAVTVSFDAPDPAGGWKRVYLEEDELDLEEHGGEDEISTGEEAP